MDTAEDSDEAKQRRRRKKLGWGRGLDILDIVVDVATVTRGNKLKPEGDEPYCSALCQ
jgi:hypothetical protein